MIPGTLEDMWHEYKKTKNLKVRDELIINYAYLVKLIAGRLAISTPPNIEFDDLLGYGIFGLIDAVDKFNINLGVKFETYAYSRIKGAIIDGVRENSWVPRSVIRKIKLVKDAIKKLQNDYGRMPKDIEICTYLNISLEEYDDIIREIAKKSILSLEEQLTKGIRLETGDKQINPEYIAEKSELKMLLAKAIDRLNQNEKLVITLYYYEGLTLKEIAATLDVSESRVSQIHTKAILRLRGSLGRRKQLLLKGGSVND